MDVSRMRGEEWYRVGGTLDRMDAFWMQRCPARGPMLTHAFTKDDVPGRCAHCGFTPDEWATATAPREVRGSAAEWPMSPIDLAARMRSLGLSRGPEEATDDIREDGVRIEPKMARGVALGKPDGKGRGDLTYRQQLRLRAWAGWSAYLDEHDPR